LAARSRKFLRSCLLLGSALLAAGACDPNVVIGAKWRLAAAGTGSETGGAQALAGSGGVAGTSGTGAVAGDLAMSAAGGAGSLAGGAGGEAGVGTAGEPAVGPIFFDDQPNGSLALWDEPSADVDAGGFYADAGVPNPTFAAMPAHSGGGSVRVSIDTTNGDQIARLYRRITDDKDAYYSAWFYLNEDHVPGAWWSIFLFRAVQDRNKSIDLWSVDLVRTAENTLTVALFDHQYQNGTGRTINSQLQPAPVVPIRAWFRLQAHLVQAWGQPSQLTLWFDGEQFMSLDMATAVPDTQPLYWVVGNGGAKMTPPKSTLFLDDAQISTSFVPP